MIFIDMSEERKPLTDKDMAMMFFKAKVDGDEKEQEKLASFFEAVDEARCNGLIVALFLVGDDIGFEVTKKPKMGFKQD